MYDRILVPLDGSRFSEEMIPHAAGLAAPARAVGRPSAHVAGHVKREIYPR